MDDWQWFRLLDIFYNTLLRVKDRIKTGWITLPTHGKRTLPQMESRFRSNLNLFSEKTFVIPRFDVGIGF